MLNPYPPKSRSVSLPSHVRGWMETLFNTIKYVSIRMFATLFIWLLWGVTISLPVGLWLIQVNINETVSLYRGDSGYTVYFEPGTHPLDIDKVVARVQSDPVVERVTLTTAAQALAEFKNKRGPSFENEIALLEENPFPASLNIFIKPELDVTSTDLLTRWLRNHRNVEEIRTDWGWLNRLSSTQRLFEWFNWVVSAMILLCSACMAVLIVRISTAFRLDEIHALWILGASKRFIRRPYFFRAFFYGIGGGVTALSLLIITAVVLKNPIDNFIDSQELNIEFVLPNFLMGAIVIGIGVVLSCFGASLLTNFRIRRVARRSNYPI